MIKKEKWKYKEKVAIVENRNNAWEEENVKMANLYLQRSNNNCV